MTGHEDRTAGPSDGFSNGVEDALAALFEHRYESMLSLATWLCGDREMAEDIVQEAFVRLGRQGITTMASPEAYLRQVVVNLCRSNFRRTRLRRFHERAVGRERRCFEPGADSALEDEELAVAVSKLPRRQQECVILRYTEDLTVPQIAAALGLTAGSVKTHLHRALASLERELAPIEHDADKVLGDKVLGESHDLT